MFKDSIEWIKGCCKSIEEFAIFKSPFPNSSKFYSLEFFEMVLRAAAEVGYNIY